MANLRRNTLLALMAVGLLTAVVIISTASRQSARPLEIFKSSGNQNNPDAFYLIANGKTISCDFTYDPHAADDWMFRTAEGFLDRCAKTDEVDDQTVHQ